MMVCCVDPQRREQHLAGAPLVDAHRRQPEFVDVPRQRRFDVGTAQHDVVESCDRDGFPWHSDLLD